MDTDGIPLLLLLIICFLANAFFSSTEMAFVAINKIRIKTMADGGNVRAKKVLRVTDQFERALSTILVGSNIANIGAASITTLLATKLWGLKALGLSTILLTAFVFFFCEMLPKSITKRCSEDVAIASAPLLLVLIKVLWPVTVLFTAWSNMVSKRFAGAPEPTYTEDELHDIVETIEDEGVLEPEERELVLSAFEFSDIQARDILIPLERVVSVPLKATEAEITKIMHENNLSRFPVYDGRREHIIGMLQANRFYSAQLKGEYKGIGPLMLPIRSYNESIHIDQLMGELNQRRSHMAMIHGEGGKTLGIVTMEDILEELVGEIYDEDDVPPQVEVLV